MLISQRDGTGNQVLYLETERRLWKALERLGGRTWVGFFRMGKHLDRLRRALGIAGGNKEIMELKMDRDLHGHVIWTLT